MAFHQFAHLVARGGRLIICSDDPVALSVPEETDLKGIEIESYGLNSGDWQAADLRLNQLGGTDFLVMKDGVVTGLVRLRVPGEHNVQNALAAIVVTSRLGVEFNVIRNSLAAFGGVGRRFQLLGEEAGVTVIDDYAHHPTEIRATLSAARQRYPGRRLWAVWQPHTFSRTKRMLDKFATSFYEADRVVVLDIYNSRETDTLGISAAMILDKLQHDDAHYEGGTEAAATYILDRLRPGDVIMTLTAGDGNLVGKTILSEVQNRHGLGKTTSHDLPDSFSSPGSSGR